MTEKELRKIQDKTAMKFFNRMKNSFDIEKFHLKKEARYSWEKDLWIYDIFWNFQLGNDRKFTIDHITPSEYGERKDFEVKASKKIMNKIEKFIRQKVKDRKKFEELIKEEKELDPINEAIEESFPEDTTEIFQTINRRQR